MTSAQETASPSEKHIQESTDYESLFNNPLWTTNFDLTQPASEENKAAGVTEKSTSQLRSPSHGERIKVLESLLKDPQLNFQEKDIQAAIRYHEKFSTEEQCGSKKIFFKHGSQVEEEEFKHSQACSCIGGWAEPPYENSWCEVIDRRVDGSNKLAPEKIEAKAEKKRERELREFNKNMLHGLKSSMLKPFRQLTKAVRN